MLRRDAETPAVLGHKAGRTRFCSRPSGTQVIPSGPPHTCSFSRPGSLLARLLFQLHLRLSRPLLSPSRGDRGGGTAYPCPGFRPFLTGTSRLYGCGYPFPRMEPPTRGSSGQRRAARERLAPFLRKTGLEPQQSGSKAGEAAVARGRLLRGPGRRFDPRA